MLSKMVVPIPNCLKQDTTIWRSATNGVLTAIAAYNFVSVEGQGCVWARSIWNRYIPPLCSFLLWRLVHDKMPTDERLKDHGCV